MKNNRYRIVMEGVEDSCKIPPTKPKRSKLYRLLKRKLYLYKKSNKLIK